MAAATKTVRFSGLVVFTVQVDDEFTIPADAEHPVAEVINSLHVSLKNPAGWNIACSLECVPECEDGKITPAK